MSLPSHAPPLPGSAPALPPPRAFGTRAEDLDLDLDLDLDGDLGRDPDPARASGPCASDRPRRVTALLAACCRPGEGSPAERLEAAWDLPLGERIVRLLEIVELTEDRSDLVAGLRCPLAGCRQAFEVTLPLAALREHAREAAPPDNVVRFPSPAGPGTLRMPTGRDQDRWCEQPYATPTEALASVVRSLLVASPVADSPLDQASLEAAAAAMEAADPLVAFRVSTLCPHCRAGLEVPVDLEAAAFARFSLVRRSLLRDIHALATRYGWTEAEVVAVPPARRAEYRRLIYAEQPDWT